MVFLDKLMSAELERQSLYLWVVSVWNGNGRNIFGSFVLIRIFTGRIVSYLIDAKVI